jgi:hypothetical protein
LVEDVVYVAPVLVALVKELIDCDVMISLLKNSAYAAAGSNSSNVIST